MNRRFLISGGGTGGHIFPALAIAKEIERRYPHCVLLFVGASDRMEMDKIPSAGYSIIGLWISGFQRFRASGFQDYLASSLSSFQGLVSSRSLRKRIEMLRPQF